VQLSLQLHTTQAVLEVATVAATVGNAMMFHVVLETLSHAKGSDEQAPPFVFVCCHVRPQGT
jgi:hypothetical protein